MPSNVPRRRPSLVGRDSAAARVATLLAASDLVTLTGPGGIGKTSLARAVLADAAGDDRWFVDLSLVRREDEVPRAVAAALGLVTTETEDPESALVAYLRPRRSLVVLDNLEHLSGVGARVRGWLDEAPDLTILATSRLPLGVRDEAELRVPGLGLPAGDSPAEVEASPAGQLFLRTARMLGAMDVLEPDVARDLTLLLRRLDGMPLAIELAAGRSRILTPAGLLRRIDDPGVLASRAGDAPAARHGSLDVVLTMTLELLPLPERRLLAALSVCPGAFELDLAQALAPEVPIVPSLDLLVSAGLVRDAPATDGESRFRLLETIRARAARALSPADRATARERHARATTSLAERLEQRRAVDERRAAAGLAAEDENIAAAVEWASRHDPMLGMRLLAAYDLQAQGGVNLERSVGWYRTMLERASADDPLRPVVVGGLLRLLVRYAGPREALALEAEVLAAAGAAPASVRRASYLRVAHAYYALGDVRAAARFNALAGDASEDPDDAAALAFDSAAALAWAVDGDADRAAALFGLSAEADARAGRLTNQGISQFKRALVELRAGQLLLAAEHARQAVSLCPPGNERAFAATVLVLALAERGQAAPAREALAAAWREVEREARIDRVEVLEAAVALLAAEGRHAEALAALQVADRERPATGWVRDEHVAFVLERWRARILRSLGPLRSNLAADDAAGMSIERMVQAALLSRPDNRTAPRPRATDELTPREVEVLALVAQGRSDGEIAAELFISRKTASVHVANIKGKLGAASRLEIALHARELGVAASAGAPIAATPGTVH